MEETILSYKDLEVVRVPLCDICENNFSLADLGRLKRRFTLIFSATICEGSFLRYLRELFFLTDLRRFKNADLR